MKTQPPASGPGSIEPPLSRDRVAAGERVVHFRPRSILIVLGVLVAVAAAVDFIILAHSALTLIAIALFLALALNPVVEFFQRRGLKRQWAVITVYALALILFALLVLVLIPPVVSQLANFAQAVPGYVTDLKAGKGTFGFLERRYHVVEQIQKSGKGGGQASLTGVALSGLSVAKGIASSIVGLLIIAFLTLFMLLEGPAWRQRLVSLVPRQHRGSVERIGKGVYRAVGGFVAGNLLASLLAGVIATILLLIVGVPYALPLGVFVTVIELIPYIGPFVVTVLLSAVALAKGPVPALAVFGVLLVYHLIEGHTVRPLIYGRTLKLSPLAVIVSILIGTEVAGILGALTAIPVAGAIQVVIAEVMRQRGERGAAIGDLV
ncbi:MAG: AI-2E family transporter [Pseudonocardiales bacterium]